MPNDLTNTFYAVGELARLSGVSIRTLHHYDTIGLLKPARVGEQGYRYYGREELLRLQQILFHRELGMSLAEIATVLGGKDFDRLASLRRQRMHILAEADRQQRLLETIDRTIAELEGRETMNDDDLYKGFAPEKQAEYEAYVIARYGKQARQHIEAGRKRMEQMTASEIRACMEDLSTIEADLASALEAGVAPDDPVIDPILTLHHGWVGDAWGQRASAEAYANLGALYASHPDFVARFEAMRPGFAQWLKRAMSAFAERALTRA